MTSTKEEKANASDKLLERMTNNEFREYLPHMELEEVLATEILRNGKWVYLLNVFHKPKSEKNVHCYVCDLKVSYKDVIEHLKKDTHLEGLKNVTQFFNPAYTYFRGAKDLMNGKKVKENEMKEAIELANGALSKRTHIPEVFSNIIQEKKPKDDSEFNILKSIVLNTVPKSPRDIFAEVNLPLLTLLTVEFSVKENEWKPMITTNVPHPNSRYQCEICQLKCGGIITVNAHLNGFAHKKMQLETLGVRCKMYDYVTKNCVYRFHQNFSFNIKKTAKVYFKDEVAEKLKETKTTQKSDDNEENKNENQNGIKKEDVNQEEKQDEKPVSASLPELAAKIKEKAVALKEQSKILSVNKESVGDSDPKNVVPKSQKTVVKSDGLIGVEYVIHVLAGSETKHYYDCVLCEYVGREDERMAEHLTSYSHRLKYLELHYPDTMERYKDKMGHMKYPNFIRVMELILDKVSIALEKHHGYGSMRNVPIAQYKKNRPKIVSELYSLPHASHKWGPSFSNVVSNDELKNFVKNKDLQVDKNRKHSIPERFTIPSVKDYNECNAAERKGRPERTRSPVHSRGDRRVESIRNRTRSRSPRNRRNDTSNRDERTRENIWKIYRREVSQAASSVERKYMDYRQHPESHPMYNQEWNRFWKVRKEELIAQGIDHRAFNFQPEWVNFFEKRIEFFFGEALHHSQVEVRRRLNIPIDAEEDTPTSSEYEPRNKRRRMEAIVPAPQWSGPGETTNYSNNRNPPPVIPPAPLVDNKPNVIHVLRLLTAFEDHLGSLGGKVMDLLSKALSFEKTCVDNPIALESKILTATNCTLIETAAEKLKGILFAGLLDSSKEQSFNRVVHTTDKLLRHAEKMGYRNIQEEVPVIAEAVVGNVRTVGGNSNAPNASDLQKLLNVLQNQKGNTNVPTQKSLSDTLMELISGQGRATNSAQSNDKVNPNQYDNISDNVPNNMPMRGGGGGNLSSGGVNNNNQYNSYRNSIERNSRVDRMDRYQQQNQQQSAIPYNNMSQNDKKIGIAAGLMNFDTNLSRGIGNSGNIGTGGSGSNFNSSNVGGSGGSGGSAGAGSGNYNKLPSLLAMARNNYTNNNASNSYNGKAGTTGGGGMMNHASSSSNSMQKRGNNMAGSRGQVQNFGKFANNDMDYEDMDNNNMNNNPTHNSKSSFGGNVGSSSNNQNYGNTNNENWGRFPTGNQQQRWQNTNSQKQQQQQTQQQQQPSMSQYNNYRRGGNA